MALTAAIVLATLVLPFLIGWWIGQPVFAAAAFAALGVTLLVRQCGIDDGAPEGEAMLGMAAAALISAAAAGFGGRVRERQRAARIDP